MYCTCDHFTDYYYEELQGTDVSKYILLSQRNYKAKHNESYSHMSTEILQLPQKD